jgi:plastocyanin
MKQKYLLPIIIVLIILGMVFSFSFLAHNKSPKSITTTTSKALPKEVTVMLNKNGFKPNVVTVKVGMAVRWENVSGDKQTVNSDDYPTNQLHKELNFGIFNSGSSVVYIFRTSGTYGYHNQLHHEQSGKIIVIK